MRPAVHEAWLKKLWSYNGVSPHRCQLGGGGAGGGDRVGAVLTWFYRPRLRHVQRELQVLTAKISGLDGKEKEKGEASCRAAANQFSYLPQSANEVIKIKVMQKGKKPHSCCCCCWTHRFISDGRHGEKTTCRRFVLLCCSQTQRQKPHESSFLMPF